VLQPTIITWILVIFGAITSLTLLFAQVLMLLQPHGERAKSILIGKGEDWRDKTHFRFSYAQAWADWLIWLPLLICGSIGVLVGRPWGYVLWVGAGTVSLYINVVLSIAEKDYVYPSCGPLAYYTYYWGFFVYWGVAAIAYSALRLSGVAF
jgi:hypothetical protein